MKNITEHRLREMRKWLSLAMGEAVTLENGAETPLALVERCGRERAHLYDALRRVDFMLAAEASRTPTSIRCP